jgi:hypothetical protein
LVKVIKVKERGRLRDRPFWKKEEKLHKGRSEMEKLVKEDKKLVDVIKSRRLHQNFSKT